MRKAGEQREREQRERGERQDFIPGLPPFGGEEHARRGEVAARDEAGDGVEQVVEGDEGGGGDEEGGEERGVPVEEAGRGGDCGAVASDGDVARVALDSGVGAGAGAVERGLEQGRRRVGRVAQLEGDGVPVGEDASRAVGREDGEPVGRDGAGVGREREVQRVREGRQEGRVVAEQDGGGDVEEPVVVGAREPVPVAHEVVQDAELGGGRGGLGVRGERDDVADGARRDVG